MTRAAAGALLVWGLQAGAETTPPTFAVSVETVYVDAFVTKGGAPVMGLSAADFEVLDNGVRQTPRLEDVNHVPITATLALDVSGSLEGERLVQLRKAGHAFVDRLAKNDRVGLLAFSHELRLLVPHTDDAAALHRGLDALPPGGHTALYDALYAGVRLPSLHGRTLLLAFTDGEDNLSWLEPQQLLRVVEASNVLIHVVGIWPAAGTRGASGPPEQVQALAHIVETTGGRLWSTQSDDLPRTFVSILDELRARYLLAYEPAGVTHEGRHRLQVRVRASRGQVRARSGYVVAPARR